MFKKNATTLKKQMWWKQLRVSLRFMCTSPLNMVLTCA
jgi:hypothetical protein